MVWCGVVWCGAVRYGEVWCGVVRCGAVWWGMGHDRTALDWMGWMGRGVVRWDVGWLGWGGGLFGGGVGEFELGNGVVWNCVMRWVLGHPTPPFHATPLPPPHCPHTTHTTPSQTIPPTLNLIPPPTSRYITPLYPTPLHRTTGTCIHISS